jgi:hypothetical protein
MATVPDLSGNSPFGPDSTKIKELKHTFTTTGVSASKTFNGPFNVDIDGDGDGTIILERSIDNKATWNPASRDSAGTQASYTAPASVVVTEVQAGIWYRFNCTVLSSGSFICTASK